MEELTEKYEKYFKGNEKGEKEEKKMTVMHEIQEPRYLIEIAAPTCKNENIKTKYTKTEEGNSKKQGVSQFVNEMIQKKLDEWNSHPNKMIIIIFSL